MPRPRAAIRPIASKLLMRDCMEAVPPTEGNPRSPLMLEKITVPIPCARVARRANGSGLQTLAGADVSLIHDATGQRSATQNQSADDAMNDDFAIFHAEIEQ